MSWTDFPRAVWEPIARVLWSHWGALGVSLPTVEPARVLVDPEALLLLTWSAGRAEPRLFDAALTWCIREQDRLDLSRLRRALDRADPEVAAVAGAWAATAVDLGASEWKRLVRPPEDARESRPLFLDATGQPLPAFGSTDEIFRRYGWLRPPFGATKGLRSVDTTSPALTRLLMRRLVGGGARAELLTAMAFIEEGTTGELAERTGYGQRSIQLVLSDLQDARLVRWERRAGVTTRVDLSAGRWRDVVRSLWRRDDGVSDEAVRYVDGLRIFPALGRAWALATHLVDAGTDAGRRHMAWEIGRELDELEPAPSRSLPRQSPLEGQLEHLCARLERLCVHYGAAPRDQP